MWHSKIQNIFTRQVLKFSTVQTANILLVSIFFVLIACSPGKKAYFSRSAKYAENGRKNSDVYARRIDKLKYKDQFKEPPVKTIYLIGDAGKYPSGNSFVLPTLQKQLATENSGSTVVFLGDNIYPAGLPDSMQPGRIDAEKSLLAQLDATSEFQGRIVFIPGNHDWDVDGIDGLQKVLNQQSFLEKKYHKKIQYPSNGCPGPEIIELDSNFVLISIDTQWWIHPHERPMGYPCNVYSEEDFIRNLEQTLDKYKNYQKLIVGHHPLISSGSHNGGFGIKTHLFPLTDFKKNAWYPLPIIGSIYVAWRTFFGHRQDMPNPRYKKLKHEFTRIFNKYPNLIYASGHEHQLGYYPMKNFHQIISGSGSKTTSILKGMKAFYAQSQYGFAKLDFFPSSTFLTFYCFSHENIKNKIHYQTYIMELLR